jgi:hypothetical protein
MKLIFSMIVRDVMDCWVLLKMENRSMKSVRQREFYAWTTRESPTFSHYIVNV